MWHARLIYTLPLILFSSNPATENIYKLRYRPYYGVNVHGIFYCNECFWKGIFHSLSLNNMSK